MRRLLLLILGLPLLLILLAALLLWLSFDSQRLISLAAEQLEQDTGARLEVRGESSLRFLPRLALQLGDAELTLPGDDPTRIHAESLSIAAKLLPLLRGQPEIHQLSIRGALVYLPAKPGETAGEPLLLKAFQASGLNLAGAPVPISLSARIPGEEPLALELEADLLALDNLQRLQLQNLQVVLRGEQVQDDAGTGDLITLKNGSGEFRLDGMTASLNAESLQIQRHPLQNAALQLRQLAEGETRIDALTGQLHEGQLETRGSLWISDSGNRYALQGSLTGLSVGALLQAMEVEAGLQGKGDLQWQLRAEGAETPDLLESLNGTVTLDSKALTLREIGVESMLCQVVAQVNQEALSTTFPADTELRPLHATLRFADGQMRLNPLRGSLQHIELTGDGRLTLATGDLHAELRARLSEGLGETDRACRVNPRLVAIDWPVKCRGQLGSEPKDWCKVDAESILAELARNELEGKAREGAGRLLQKLLGGSREETPSRQD